jgi:hypothetical protein
MVVAIAPGAVAAGSGALALAPAAVLAGGAASWHPLQASSENEDRSAQDQRIMRGTLGGKANEPAVRTAIGLAECGGACKVMHPAMLRMPTRALTQAAKKNLDRFFRTSAAREIEDDPRTWTVVEWTWALGPPMRVALRDEECAVIDFVMDKAGLWHLSREPMDPKILIPGDLSR